MTALVQKTAILIFTQSAEVEQTRKPLGRNSAEGQSVFKHLNNKVLRLARRAGLPFFLTDETKQRGNSFGERMSNAVEDVFTAGFTHVIVIGNDSYGLALSDLRKAKANLENGLAVLGPSMDGGDYLIGMSKSSFDSHSFKDLKWQSRHSHAALKDYFEKQGTAVMLLRYLRDLDNASDLEFALNLGDLNIPELSKEKPLGNSFFNQRIINSESLLSIGLRAPPVPFIFL